MAGFVPMQPVLLNGQPADGLSLSDRGLHYGDGLFETIAVLFGRPILWQFHFERLVQGCERLGFPLPDSNQLRTEIDALGLSASPRAVVKIILTRGSGGRGYRPLPTPTLNRIVYAYPWPDHPETWAGEGIHARLCTTRLAISPTLAGIKHLNRLEQVLARNEWLDETIPEGVMTNATGDVIEGTQSNLFLVRDGVLLTPRLDQSGVRGVMRQLVMMLAKREGIPVREQTLNVESLFHAEEIFFTNSLIRIWPVRRLEGHEFAAPGPLTRQLQQAVETTLSNPGRD